MFDFLKKKYDEILDPVNRGLSSMVQRGRTSGQALSQGRVPQTRDIIPFQQQRRQIGQTLANNTRQLGNRVSNIRLENLSPQTNAISVARQRAGMQSFTPTIREQFEGTIAKPLRTAFDPSKSLLDRGIGAVQGGFNSTPVGQAWQIGTGTVAGALKSIRTGAPLDESLRQSISNPMSDVAMEGLGIENPLIAMPLNFLTLNPKATLTGVGKLRGIKQTKDINNILKQGQALGLDGINPKAFKMHPDDVAEGKMALDILRNKATFRVTKDMKGEAMKTIQNLLEGYAPGYKYSKNNKAYQAIEYLINVNDKVPKDLNVKLPKMGIVNQGKGSQAKFPKGANQQKIPQTLKAKTTNDPVFSGEMNQATLVPKKQGVGTIQSREPQNQFLQSTSPYEGSIAQNTNKILTGTPVKERGFVSTVKLSPKTPKKIKDMVSGSYIVKSTNQLRADARELIRTNPVAAEQVALNPTADVHIQIGNELIEYYGSRGNFRKATEIAEGMANSGTDLGRAVQAFSNYDKTSPQGVVRFAQKTVNAYNKKNPQKKLNITDKQIESLFNRARKIQNMPEGRNRNIASYQLMEEVNNLIPSSRADKFITVWKAGLLTSLRTQERNILGNTAHGLAEVVKDIPASLADRIMALRTGQRSTVFTTKGTLGGLKQGFKSAKDIITKGYDPEDVINKYDVRRITWGNNKVEQALKHYTNAVFRSLGASDKPAWNAAFARSLYNQAQTQALNAGKRGSKTFVERLVKKPTTEMLAIATKDANIAVFKDNTKLGNVARALQDFKVGGAPVGQIFAPFTGVPSNIAVQMFEYSPLGLIRGASTMGRVLAKNIPELQRQAAQEIGRGVMGTGLMGLGAYLMSQGLMTGQPKDAKEYAQWQLEGKQPNSVLINGKWRSVNSVGPEFLIVLSGAKLQEELSDPEGSMGRYAGNVGKDFLGQTFLQGVQGPLQAVNDPDRYATSYGGQQFSSVVPNIVRDTAKAFDPYQRENNNIQDYFLNSLPGLRNQGVVKRDALGNPMKQEPTGLSAYYDLFNSKTPVTGNSVVDELSRLNNAGFNATPSKLQKKQTINGKEMELTPDQLDTLEAESGILVRERLAKLVGGKYYQNLSDEDKKDAISDAVSDARKEAKKDIDLDLKAKVKATFESNPEDPQNIVDKILLASRGVVVDPGNTIKAIFTEEELRKIEGNAVILKRQQNLNQLDNKNLHVDHIIPLGMGGDNSPENLQVVEKEVKKSKDKLEKELIRKLQNGEITRQEAQKQIKEWSANNPIGVPLSEFSAQKQSSLIESSDIESEGEDYIVNEEGDKIELTPPTKGTGIGSFANTDWNITKARSIWNNDKISKEEKNKAFKKLGVEAEDVRYDALANYSNDIKAQYIASKNFDHDKLIDELEKGRIPSISGKLMAANGVIDDLEEMGLISDAEAKYLKKLNYNKDGTLKKGSGGSKGRKPTLPEIKHVKLSFGSAKRVTPVPSATKVTPVRQYKLVSPVKSGSSANVPKVKRLPTII